MKGRETILVLLLVILNFAVLNAQDLHFSQFNNSPITLNPAFSGINGCSYRLVANYKAQWTNLDAFQTYAVSYDMAVLKHGPKSNFGGVGLSLMSDVAGDLNFKTNMMNLSLSYTVLLNKKGTQSISTGLVGGVGIRSFDASRMTTDAQFAENGFDPSLNTMENIPNSRVVFADVGAGFLWNYNVTKNSNYYAGLALSHVNQPGISFVNQADERLFMKFTFHGGALIPLTNLMFLMPSFMYLHQGPHDQLNLGTYVKLRKSIDPKDKTAFYLGGWYRWKDALIFAARVDIAGFNVGFSYDVTLSELTKATLNGGPELSVIYTGCFNNKKNAVVFCPTL